jgi:deoxyribodipyrimidine photolyase-related protein
MKPPASGFRGHAGLRNLILVLGDQLDLDAAAFDDFDAAHDAAWMAEVAEESTHVWSNKPRTAMFLAGMRHFAQALRAAGRTLHYTALDAEGNRGSLQAQLQSDIERLRPARLVMTTPGDWRVLQAIKAVARAHGLPLDIREDRHFYCSVCEFAVHARGRKSLRMEYFYREMRKRHGVLMAGEAGDEPEGGQWNFDAENREAFGSAGPGTVPPRAAFAPDAITSEVIALVEARFATHPGRLDRFAWPVTREQALVALQRFVAERLPLFGRYQDAMWPGDP